MKAFLSWRDYEAVLLKTSHLRPKQFSVHMRQDSKKLRRYGNISRDVIGLERHFEGFVCMAKYTRHYHPLI